ATVICGQTAYDWNTMPMSRSCGGTRMPRSGSDTVLPSIETEPAAISSSPAMHLSVVLLPQPDGPRSETNSPSATSNETPSTTRLRPKTLVRLLTLMLKGQASCQTTTCVGRQPQHQRHDQKDDQ